jgi:hypothetical protein
MPSGKDFPPLRSVMCMQHTVLDDFSLQKMESGACKSIVFGSNRIKAKQASRAMS